MDTDSIQHSKIWFDYQHHSIHEYPGIHVNPSMAYVNTYIGVICIPNVAEF